MTLNNWLTGITSFGTSNQGGKDLIPVIGILINIPRSTLCRRKILFLFHQLHFIGHTEILNINFSSNSDLRISRV